MEAEHPIKETPDLLLYSAHRLSTDWVVSSLFSLWFVKSLHDQLDLLSLSSPSLPSPWFPSVLPNLFPRYVSLSLFLKRVPKKINLICANEILILGTSCRLTASGGKRSTFSPQLLRFHSPTFHSRLSHRLRVLTTKGKKTPFSCHLL